MEPHDGINASTFYGRPYKDLEFAIGDLEDDDKQIDLTIIPPSPDYETDLDDIDKDNIQSDVLPAVVLSETGVLIIEEGDEKVEKGDIEDLELSETEATSNMQNQPENVTITKESSEKEGNTQNVGFHGPAKLRKTYKPDKCKAPKNVKGTTKTTTKSDETDVQINKAYQLLTQVVEKCSSKSKDACALFTDDMPKN
ncbi:hypothetical protein FQA39_LY05436 [Lamprigera yunnana]|nr:hypothetical protein FQA39_LY05436 [Lamprigera yunnana]